MTKLEAEACPLLTRRVPSWRSRIGKKLVPERSFYAGGFGRPFVFVSSEYLSEVKHHSS
ncbi:MAG: hypothetical protein J5586_00015 [Clostridia bacterium]|jgi:hypothetical protein|nr:hypothetical protein [Clostridia bacterium]